MMTPIPNSDSNHKIPLKREINRLPPKTEKLPKIDLFDRDDYFIEDQADFQSGSQKRSGFKLALWSWMSAFIDTLILISISCFCMILFSVLMRTPAREVIKFMFVETNLMRIFMISFLICIWIYLIVMRIFMGASIGEWSCQLRLGQPLQRIRSSYVLRVVARTTLILLTGVITLPILSVLLKRDLAGELTGIKVYSLM